MTRRIDSPPDKVLPNGVVVRGNLTVNEISLQGWYDNLFFSERKPPTIDDARAAGFAADEIQQTFGQA